MALRNVNLVPPDLMARTLLGRHLSVWSCCLLLSLAICLGLYLAGALIISAQHQSLMKRNGEPRFVAMMEEQKRLQNEFTTLDRQKSELRAIESRKQSLAPVLGRLSEIMNGGTWLSQLSLETTEGQRGGTELVLVGSATSNDNLGDFLNRLSGDRLFREVTLRSSTGSDAEQEQKGGRGPVRFQIACRLNKGSGP